MTNEPRPISDKTMAGRAAPPKDTSWAKTKQVRKERGLVPPKADPFTAADLGQAEPAPAPTDDQVLAHVFHGEHDASVQAIVDGLADVGPAEQPTERLRESVNRLEAAEPTERTGPFTTADPDASRKAVLPDWRFLTKDSGTRVEFPTGSRRDDATGKGRFDLLPFEAVNRYAQLLERGAAKYDARNWEKGQPFSRVFSSLLRHAHQAAAGMSDEDHLAAVMFNAAALITFAERIARGELPDELNDMPWAA